MMSNHKNLDANNNRNDIGNNDINNNNNNNDLNNMNSTCDPPMKPVETTVMAPTRSELNLAPKLATLVANVNLTDRSNHVVKIDSKTAIFPIEHPSLLAAKNNLNSSNKYQREQEKQQLEQPVVDDKQTPDLSRKMAKQQKKWNKRFRILFCCLGHKKNKDSIADVATIFAEFYADLKVPSADVAAGFVLLSKYQSAQRKWILNNNNNRNGNNCSNISRDNDDIDIVKSSSTKSITNGPVDKTKEQEEEEEHHHLNKQNYYHSDIEQYLNNVPIRANTKFLDLSTAEDSHIIHDLIHYLNYSLAIFGWPMHIVDDPCLLCCIYPYLRLSLCCSSKKSGRGGGSGHTGSKGTKGDKTSERSNKNNDKKDKNNTDKSSKSKSKSRAKSKESSPDDTSPEAEMTRSMIEEGEPAVLPSNTWPDPSYSRSDQHSDIPIVLNDNCCSCNVASAERRLAKHNYEIIYVSYKVNINVVPFLVAADHSKRSIVVAIRGSMSMSDMVTDMNGQIDKVPLAGCPDDWLCHRGITRAAQYVQATLKQDGILERARQCRPDLESENYSLVLCGHSLGAGAAAILGILMRPEYPNLRAYLYSPPGGILSKPVVEYTKEFALGVILGNDTVCRLGIAQLERLRYQTLLSIKSSQRSSAKILAKALCPNLFCCRLCGRSNGDRVDYDPTKSLDLLHGQEARPFEFNGSEIPFQSQSQVLYVPGKLIHVVKNYSYKQSTKSNTAKNNNSYSTKSARSWQGPIYQAIWTDNELYDRVMISEGMFIDHLPNKLMDAMKMLFSRTLPPIRQQQQQQQKQATTVMTTQPTGLKQLDKLNLDHDRLMLQTNSEYKIKVVQDYDDTNTNNSNNNVEDENNNNNNNDDNNNNINNIRGSKLGEPCQEQEQLQKQEQQQQDPNAQIIGKFTLDENGNEERD